MDKIEKFFEKIELNKQQFEIVTAPVGVYYVAAGAGTGKTKILTSRIIYMHKFLELFPSEILAMTFTNKATKEMKDRVLKMTGSNKFDWINTFHAFCRKFLLYEGSHCLKRKENFVIIDEEDQLNIIKQIYKENNYLKSDLAYTTTLKTIDLVKNSNKEISVEKALAKILTKELEAIEDKKRKIIITVFNEYEKHLIKQNLLDFNDLLIFTYEILSTNEMVLEKWQNRFKCILVDEFQDTNMIQYQIVRLLAGLSKNLFLVGDPDQSIYGWRGASNDIAKSFFADFPEHQIFLLEENYRSTDKILNAANSLIKKNFDRIEKHLFTQKKSPKKVIYFEAYNKDDEANWLANEIKKIVNEKEFSYKDICILYRSSFWSRNIEQSLINNAIPYYMYGGLRFYMRKEIKDLLAYIRTIVHGDDVSLLRIINVPSRKIGDATIDIIQKYSNKEKLSLLEILKNINQYNGISVHIRKKVDSFLKELQEIKNKIKNDPSKIIDAILQVTNYEQTIEENRESKLDNIHELSKSISEFLKKDQRNDLIGYLNYISLYTEYDSKESLESDCVSLMTVHFSKGLEFPCVFISGLVDNVFPSKYSIESKNPKQAIEEERRIAYVAMTRAKNKLYMLSCKKSSNFFSSEEFVRSRFIDEIGLENFDVIQRSFKPIDKSQKLSSTDWYDSKKAKQISYDDVLHSFDVPIQVGEIITHKIFGSGVVVKVDDQIIDVKFKSPIGVKSLLKNHKLIIRRLS